MADTANSAFTAFYAESEAARTGFEDMLRPRLGDPNHREELEILCNGEGERATRAKEKIIGVHSNLLREANNCADAFVVALRHTSVATIALLDSLLMVSDLSTLPGDDQVVTKRMGLRRLRAARAKQEEASGAEDSGESGDARGIKHKEWPGLAVDKLQGARRRRKQLQLGANGADGETEADADEAAESSENYEQKNTEIAEAVQQALDALAEPSTSIFTPQHRAAMQARADVFEAYVSWWDELAAQRENQYGTLLRHEERWTASWELSVAQLQKMSGSIP